MNKPTIAITGANGYLGNFFLNHFIQLDWRVKAFTSSSFKQKIKEVTYINYSLNKELRVKDFDNVDYVIHAAYIRFDINKKADDINYRGTEALVMLCDELDIPIIYLSSFSAHDKAISHYGTSKMKCERLFDLKRHIILKIGFIIGQNGILGEMIQQMKSYNFFPLVGGSEDLCKTIESVISNKISGTFNISHEEVVSMREFYKTLAIGLDRKLKFIPIPMSLLYIGCKVLETIGFQLPVSSESVLGLKRMRSYDTIESQKQLNIDFKDYKTSLMKIIN